MCKLSELYHSFFEQLDNKVVTYAMADDGEPRKRSRFDQTSAEPAKKSRFDRRSRSPAREEAEAKRSRSPASKAGDEDVQSPGAKAKRDAMKAAEEAAARINASLKAKTTVQKVDVPPVRSVSRATTAQFRWICC